MRIRANPLKIHNSRLLACRNEMKNRIAAQGGKDAPYSVILGRVKRDPGIQEKEGLDSRLRGNDEKGKTGNDGWKIVSTTSPRLWSLSGDVSLRERAAARSNCIKVVHFNADNLIALKESSNLTAFEKNAGCSGAASQARGASARRLRGQYVTASFPSGQNKSIMAPC